MYKLNLIVSFVQASLIRHSQAPVKNEADEYTVNSYLKM